MVEQSGYFSRIKNRVYEIAENERAQIAAAVLICNSLIIGEMLLFSRGLDQQRQYITRIGKCFTQSEADLIMQRPRVGSGGILGDFLRERAQIRLVYTSQRYAVEVERERNRLRDQGHDVTASPADGPIQTGQAFDCRVTVVMP